MGSIKAYKYKAEKEESPRIWLSDLGVEGQAQRPGAEPDGVYEGLLLGPALVSLDGIFSRHFS